MNVAFSSIASLIGEGDIIISPFSSRKLRVKSAKVVAYGMIDLVCVDEYGDIVSMSLDPGETIKVFDN